MENVFSCCNMYMCIVQRPARTNEIVALANEADAFTSGVIRECKIIPLEGERAVSIVLCYLVQHPNVFIMCICSLQSESGFCHIIISQMYQYSVTVTSNLPNPFHEL